MLEHVKNIGQTFPRYRDKIILYLDIWIMHRDNKDIDYKKTLLILEREIVR